MATNNTEALNNFIIDATLIDPIRKIVKQLEAGSYRDCDIKWLDEKLQQYTLLACETLGIKIEHNLKTKSHTVLNDYNKSRYLKYFNTLLNYFKSF
ncbi:hypothetical protein [Chryseobacterium daeguense]|uniref:hypothetical protein n=1 Tax=Chryseobacterium daeguense TaxID=412438 RepID=UPI0004892882|nr:hypothetical protein [Chryseobacterium daeguense]